MSVQSCDIKDNVTGNDEFSKVAYSEEFKVIVQVGDQPATILTSNHPDVPQVGDPHPIDTRATVKSRSVKATKARELWILTVMYEYALGSGEDGGGGGGGGGQQLLDITGGVWYETYTAQQDANNKAYKNTVGDPIEKQSTRPHPTFTITTRSQNFVVPVYWGLTGQVNSGPFSMFRINFPKHTLLFDEFNFKSMQNGWWEYTYVFKARMVNAPKTYDSEQNGEDNDNRSGGWTDYILNAGYREKRENGAIGPIIPRQEDGQERLGTPVTSPWPLDKEGKAIPRADFKQKAEWLEFQEYPETWFRVFAFNWESLLTREAARTF